MLLLRILAVRLSVRAGMPSLLVYLGNGLALEESGLGVRFDAVEVALALGYAALVLLLAEGGPTTPWREIRPVLRIGVSTATVGVAVSVLVVAPFDHLVHGLSWQLTVLLGAVLSPTDAAAVFSVLPRVPLPPRLSGALEAESGLDDAPHDRAGDAGQRMGTASPRLPSTSSTSSPWGWWAASRSAGSAGGCCAARRDARAAGLARPVHTGDRRAGGPDRIGARAGGPATIGGGLGGGPAAGARRGGVPGVGGAAGAVPIVFTTIPLAAGVDGAEQLFDLVFVLVVVDTVVTATTLPWVARVLRVVRRHEPRDLQVEAAPLVVREGQTLVPERRTVLRRGDELPVVTPRAVSLGGRLAQWLGTRPS